ncbi:type II toxin-antitoxin system VapC family toxin [Mucilaginibacter paludis]|uniref:PilT protein domain protein n=1 Tax=Mucilaginibacter paludis DSM 18603 TaxID=714943 RepID=H1Y1R9_9SPHI|nr:type II toxin-antitoxin system VapC family toxin [Mucilaginibacter paludis]EHQ24728.1 PilT protein domain protein [Mucilaginibacter paludis DSM 18603]
MEVDQLKVVYLFDSNAVIDYLSLAMPPTAIAKLRNIVDDGVFISVITKIEVLGFDSKNIQLDANNEMFINRTTVFELSPDIVRKTIDIRKATKVKLPDAIIAATALVHDLTLLTHNVGDFNKIPGLNVLDSHSL